MAGMFDDLVPTGRMTSEPAVMIPRAPIQPSNRVWGDAEAEAAGLYEVATPPQKTAAISFDDLVPSARRGAQAKLAEGLAQGKSGDQDIYRAAAFRTNEGRPKATSADLAASGATFGWLDEAMAAGTAPIDMAMRGESFDEAYAHNLAAERDRLDQYRKENPLKALAAEVVGGLAAGPKEGVAIAASLPGRIFQGGKYGAVTGGLTGAGSTEGDRVEGAASGAALGGTLGAGIPAAVSTIRAVASPITRNISGAVNPEGRAIDQLRRDLSRDGVTPATARAQLDAADATGAPMTIGDLGGRNVMGLGRAVATGKSAGSERYNSFLEARRLESPDRIMDNVKTALGDADAFYPTLERIIARRKEVAAPLYERAYAQQAPDTPTIRSVLSTPAGQNAIRDAQRLSANEGIEFAADVRGLDLIKRSFDDMIETAKRGGQNNEMRVLVGMRDRLVKEVDRKVPEYRAARDAFSSEAQLQGALERGRELLKPGNAPEVVVKELRAMAPAEQEVARLGMARQLRDTFDDPSMTASKLSKLVNSNRSRQIIDAIFPTKEAGAKFRSDMMREMMMLKRGQQVQGGSNSVNKLAEGDDAGLFDAAINVARNPISGSIAAATDIGRRFTKGVNEKTANVLGDILSSTDINRQRQILQQIEQMLPPGAIERLLTAAGPRPAVQQSR